MNALLSIKPKYADAIARGDKRYEFRRSVFRGRDVENIFIYSTAPVKKIVGSFTASLIIEDIPERLWDQLKDLSGLDDLEFFSYFKDCKKGFAIKIETVTQFREPVDPRDLIDGFIPPRSFYYIDADFSELLLATPQKAQLPGSCQIQRL